MATGADLAALGLATGPGFAVPGFAVPGFATGLGTFSTRPQPGHFAAAPAFSSGTLYFLPQEHENEIVIYTDFQASV